VFMNTKAGDFLKELKADPKLGFFSMFQKDRQELVQLHQTAASSFKQNTVIDYDSTYLRFVELSVTPTIEANDSLVFITVLHLFDFRTESQLDKEVFKAKYENILENIPSMIWITNNLNRPIFTNKAMQKFLGLDIAEIKTQQEFENLIYYKDRPVAITKFNEQVRQRLPVSNEFRIRTADGSFKWVMEDASPQFGPNNEYLGYHGKITNINELKKVQLALKNAETEMGFLVNEGGIFICKHDLNGNLIELSKACTQVIGYAPEELVGRNIRELVYVSDYEKNFEPGHFMHAIEKNIPLVNRIKTKSGVYKWIEMQGAYIKNEKDQPTGIICAAKDVSERMDYQLKLELNNKIIENTDSIVIVTDKNGKTEWVNDAFVRHTGYSEGDILGKTPASLLQGEGSDPEVIAYMSKCLKEGIPFHTEIINYNKKGEPYWISIHCEAIRNQNGEVEKYFAIEENITERKGSEELIRTAATFPELNPNPILRIDRKGEIIYKNRAADRLEEIFFNGNYFSLKEFCHYLKDNVKGKEILTPVEINRRYYEITCVEITNGKFINIYCSDITELTNTSLKLKNNERKYRYLAENSKDLICLQNAVDQFIYASPSSEKLLEYDAEEMASLSMIEICHPEDQEIWHQSFEKILEGELEMTTLEIRLRKKSGNYSWFEIQLYPVIEESIVAGVQSSSRDITQQKYQEFRLKANERKYMRLIDNMDLGYVEVDTMGLILSVNDSFCRLTKYTREELIGQNPETFLLPSEELKKEMRDHNENRSSGMAEVYQIQLRRKDGIIRTVLISGAPLVNQENLIVGSAGIHWDITPMLEMESRLHEKEVQRQRNILQASIRSEEKQKQTLGRELHDGLGQLLAYISINMQLMLDTHNSAEEIVVKTKELMNKAIAEVRQLSRTLIPVALDNTKQLKEIIHESLVLYANLKGIRFDIEKYDSTADLKLNLDQKHIVFRILQELTNNTIKYAEATHIKLSIHCKNKFCHFEYNDNGKGFNPVKVKKGVGFESIHTRIESYNGKLQFNSKPGKGMKAVFSLPLEYEQKVDVY